MPLPVPIGRGRIQKGGIYDTDTICKNFDAVRMGRCGADSRRDADRVFANRNGGGDMPTPVSVIREAICKMCDPAKCPFESKGTCPEIKARERGGKWTK